MELFQSNPQFQVAKKVCEELQARGYQALLAGGCVRDLILGFEPRDFDVATSALPDEVEKIFPRTIAVGKAFGVIHVIDSASGIEVEVATFRSDGEYKDGRRPEKVSFSSPQEDAQRRDLTINALFYDLREKKIIDYCSGQEDLRDQIIRTVGEPEKRFQEDHLRILRAIRFVSQLGFEIDQETWHAIVSSRHLLKSVSSERVHDELIKLLSGAHVEKGLKALWRSQVLEELTGVSFPWRDPAEIFSRKQKDEEDLWFRFFLWIYLAMEKAGLRQLSIKDFEMWCDEWKFSNRIKQRVLTSLYWMLHNSFLKKTSMGELLELSYEPENLRAWREYEIFYATQSEREILQKMSERRKELGDHKPKPLIQAKDMMAFVQGPELGKALSWCYWRQLEGEIQGAENLLKIWKEKHGKND